MAQLDHSQENHSSIVQEQQQISSISIMPSVFKVLPYILLYLVIIVIKTMQVMYILLSLFCRWGAETQ